MWLIVRTDGRVPATGRVLAESPDSGVAAGDPQHWLWSITQGTDLAVSVQTNPQFVAGDVRMLVADTSVTRAGGTILAAVPVVGGWEVGSSTGPWPHVLSPGDVFLAEDDRVEHLRIAPVDLAADPALSIVVLTPAPGAPPLRWVP